MKIRVHWGWLDDNSHGTERRGEPWNQETKRSCASIVPLGRSMYLKSTGRTSFGRRLWIYGPSGACVHLDLVIYFDVSPCPPGSKYGPQDDDEIGTIIL